MKLVHFPRRAAAAVLAAAVLAGAALPVFASDTSPCPKPLLPPAHPKPARPARTPPLRAKPPPTRKKTLPPP